ncbi:MAG: hypothetical protein U0793_00795 [Gemmataceae bacterium]
MSTTITGVVTNGVVVPSSPLPEGAKVEVVVVTAEAAAPQCRGVPAAQVRGIAAGAGVPPDDETIKRWIEEHRLEKHG